MDRFGNSRRCLLVAGWLVAACAPNRATPGPASDEVASVAQPIGDLMAPIRRVPPVPKQDPRRVALGRRLFMDPKLSEDDTIACASCHIPDHAGVDGRPRSIGIGGQVGAFNTPTVFNAALNFRQFWDGRVETLEAQVAGPLQNPMELGSSFEAAIAKLERDPSYLRQIREVYGTPHLTAALLCDAIATFERSLVLPGSPFDRFLAGEEPNIAADERQGYELFKSYGCSSCHQGTNVGGNMFERFGVARDYFGQVGHPSRADLGRYNITGREEDRHVFRVPSLRLVTMTGPYLHDGSIQNLGQMVRLMGRYQLGRELSETDVQLIVKFLGTLVGSADEVTLAATR
jgi:cytochrome c peroxidase